MCFNEVLYQLEEFPRLFIGGGHKGYFIVYNYLSEELVESANVDCISAVVTMIKKLNNNSDVTNWDSLVNSCKKIWIIPVIVFPNVLIVNLIIQNIVVEFI